MGKKAKGFNNPFEGIGKRLGDRVAAPAPEAPVPEAKAPEAPEDDASIFQAYVGAVKPLEQPKVERRPVVRPEPQPRLGPDEDAEVVAVLSELVSGEGSFDIADTQEYVEGLAHGVDRGLLQRLKRGDYSVQAHLDLHGMVREEARLAVRRFIAESRTGGLRCVLIVHGRGLNSPGGEPVLKAAVVRWLSRGRLGRQVLAFATALRHDGGAGALYVLLRR